LLDYSHYVNDLKRNRCVRQTLFVGPMALDAGTLLGRYEIRGPLGSGGMGEVYLAEDTQLGRTVALKILPADLTSDQQRMHRFAQEARTASALNHPNILTIHEIVLEGPHPFIVTEHIEGMTLRDYMISRRMNFGQALGFTVQTASALAAAHKAGVVHRDIKPENIMIRNDGYIKVLDFGLAKMTLRPDTTPEAVTLLNTDPGMILGTARHMSPEQARGLELDARTDIFSLGTVLYEMITGRAPFEGPTNSDVIAAILKEDPPPLGEYAPEAPAELQRIVNRALAKDLEGRYQTVTDLFTDLKNLKRELEFEAHLGTSSPVFLARVMGLKRELESEAQLGPSEQLQADTNSMSAASTAAQATITAKEPSAGAPASLGSERKKRRLTPIVTGTVALAAVVVIAYSYYFRTPSQAIDSVAVLPFATVGGDADTEYLSDGITESLINSLSQLPNLKVIARSSVFRYKGKQVDPQTVGRELRVRAVLTGKVVRLGDTLTIQTDLVDVSNQTQLWGEKYNRKVADILAVEDEISSEISNKLRLTLTGEEKKQLVKRYTESADAYQLYWKGRYHWNKRTPEDIKEAIKNFQQAINLDPGYALAYTGLADCYVLGSVLQLPPKEAMPIALDATKKALAIDDKLAEAHTSLAKIKLSFEWDWPNAENEFKRAIELNPGYATAHQWYGIYLSEMGRHDESMRERKLAQELDPLSLSISTGLGRAFFWARRYDEAIDHLQKTLEQDPKYPDTHWSLGLAYEQKKMYAEAIASFQKAVEYSRTTELAEGKPEMQAALAHALAVGGRRTEALKIVADLTEEPDKQRYISPYSMALVYVGLGDKQQSFDWLDRAYQERDESFIHLRVDPRLDDLRADPQFIERLHRIHLD
jgi:eukaryotic-like serine/threonine-protein kinase